MSRTLDDLSAEERDILIRWGEEVEAEKRAPYAPLSIEEYRRRYPQQDTKSNGTFFALVDKPLDLK